MGLLDIRRRMILDSQNEDTPGYLTAKLIPSNFMFSDNTKMSVQDVQNMYTDCDSDTCATVTNSENATTQYYFYIKGFDFDSLPQDAIVESFTIRVKGSNVNCMGGDSYVLKLGNGKTVYTNTSTDGVLTNQAKILTFTSLGGLTFENLKNFGSNMTIRVSVRRGSASKQCYVYIYGAEIEVHYTLPVTPYV